MHRAWWALIALLFLLSPGCSCDFEIFPCGNGKVGRREQCDDRDGFLGNLFADGCKSCRIVPGWNCSGEPSVCMPICGDGRVVGGEDCDPGTTTLSDGCLGCRAAPGWSCEDSRCSPVCGDGIILGDEACDDRDRSADDGCDLRCRIEPGWVCTNGSATSECERSGWVEIRRYANGPVPRRSAHAFWTGEEILLYGGVGPLGPSTSFARYDMAVRDWILTSTVGGPPALEGNSAVWTDEDLIVWGGNGSSGFEQRGWRWHASLGWSETSSIGAPSPRARHAAVWAGGQMIVWGGQDSSGSLSDGARYDPSIDAWAAIPSSTIAAAVDPVAVWTGTEMFVIGPFAPPARYRPSEERWVPTAAPPIAIVGSMIWTGTEVLIVGVTAGAAPTGAALLYHPETDGWRVGNALGQPSARVDFSLVWSGNEAIVWGGRSVANGPLRNGARYDSVGDRWLPIPTDGAPSARYSHIAVWTGTELFVWGGFDGAFLGDGGRYWPD
jgi:cysteine-rich repeat protein